MDCAMDVMQGELFKHCCQCGSEFPANEAVEVEVYRPEGNKVYHVCTELCRQGFRLFQMRRLEGSSYVPEL